mgnify:CR=1 FL=1
MKLDGVSAIVTGGGSGLGEATARALAAGGARGGIERVAHATERQVRHEDEVDQRDHHRLAESGGQLAGERREQGGLGVRAGSATRPTEYVDAHRQPISLRGRPMGRIQYAGCRPMARLLSGARP